MPKIICNPLNLPYRYQNRIEGGRHTLSREAADPTMLLFGEHYLLFASMSGGFWYSEDLTDWKFHETPELPIYDYAPDVRVIDGKVIFSASSRGKCRLYVSEDPLNIPFTALPIRFAWWDPDIFQDDDGKIYFYWGCSTKPIMGTELDRKTLKPIGPAVKVIGGHPETHGWERRGENNIYQEPVTHMDRMLEKVLGKGPFIEGAYMTKHDGKYYLQYAAPGTEYNVYGNGVYVGDHPPGPFTYQRHNPFSAVPGGFLRGAGHGSTFQDKSGKWWHIASMVIAVNEKFERRLGLFPLEFDNDGIMYCKQQLADYPFDALTGEKMGWMLLNGEASASSCQEDYEPEKCCDENCKTWWAAAKKGNDQWLKLDLGERKTVHAVQVNFADHQLTPPEHGKKEYRTVSGGKRLIYVQDYSTPYTLEGSADGENWTVLHQNAQDRPHDLVVLEEPMALRYLRLSGMEHPFGGVSAVMGLRVFGFGNGEKPQKVGTVYCRKNGELNRILRWDAAEGAARYNVRYGIAPNKLYGSWQTEKTELDFSFVNMGETYYFAVDSINENGVTAGSVVKIP